MTNSLIRIYARPKLNAPVMLAAWPGISSVATIVATYLAKKLEFKLLGEIEASYFFDPIGVLARDNVIEEPQFPQSTFYYWKHRKGEHDIVLFVGEAQPSAKSYELAHCVLDVAARFQVQRIVTCAAAATRIHHSEQPKAWGVVTGPSLVGDLEKYNLVQKGPLHISGLNGLLLGVAKERNMDGICLLGEVPMYATRMPNPMAALAVLRVLTGMLGIRIDLKELEVLSEETRERIKQAAAQAMGEYIDYFTEPIWEQGEDDEGEYQEEG